MKPAVRYIQSSPIALVALLGALTRAADQSGSLVVPPPRDPTALAVAQRRIQGEALEDVVDVQDDHRRGKQRLDEISGRLVRSTKSYLRSGKEYCQGVSARLEALNPEAILKRGYAMITTEDGTTVYQVGQTSTGQQLQVLQRWGPARQPGQVAALFMVTPVLQ